MKKCDFSLPLEFSPQIEEDITNFIHKVSEFCYCLQDTLDLFYDIEENFDLDQSFLDAIEEYDKYMYEVDSLIGEMGKFLAAFL